MKSSGPSQTSIPAGQLPRLTAVPAARSRAAVLKVRLALLLGALLLSSAMGLFAAISFLRFEVPVVDVDSSKPRGRAVAELAALSYLAGGSLDLPSLNGQQLNDAASVDTFGPITWDGFERSTLPSLEQVESHRFLFYRVLPLPPAVEGAPAPTPEYQLMTLTVLVAVPASGNPVLAARPYFAPAEYRDNNDIVADYTDSAAVAGLPSAAVDQLQSWAGAWASDDYEKLKLLTGDQTPGVRYRGLGGYQFVEMRVISSIRTATDGYLVRARVVLASANGSTLEMDMDITVDSASTGLPNVIGWGPAGSGIAKPSDVRVSEDS